MVDTVKSRDVALEIGRVIDEHKGADTVVIDVREQSSWTSFFVISTVYSVGHLKGLTRHIKNLLRDTDVNVLHRHKRIAEDGWELIDCGSVVIHLMNEEMRDFYDLEKLWFSGEVLYQSDKSSKSSYQARLHSQGLLHPQNNHRLSHIQNHRLLHQDTGRHPHLLQYHQIAHLLHRCSHQNHHQKSCRPPYLLDDYLQVRTSCPCSSFTLIF